MGAWVLRPHRWSMHGNLVVGNHHVDLVHVVERLYHLFECLLPLRHKVEAFVHRFLIDKHHGLVVPSAKFHHDLQQGLVVEIEVTVFALHHRIGVDLANAEALGMVACLLART